MTQGKRPLISLRRDWSQQSCIALCFLLAGGLTACTTGSRATSDTFRLLLNRNVQATAQQVAANRYPQLQLKADDVSAVSVLGHVDRGELVWYAGTHAIFYTSSSGLLTGTTGLNRTYASRIIGDSPFDHLQSVSQTTTINREYDWLPEYKMGAQVVGTLIRKSAEPVEILGRTMSLMRFEEELSGAGMNHTNVYWADQQSGFIWKSTQYLAPGYRVELTQLKPFRPKGS
ncbi:YjbF family lipoprotein [Stenotrophomonas sp. WHRI 8082]|uniref:YjbF family lipoprotein n=1 Tax=Stenotrophomonas sp. WHRI 8082 TaxID=3162571 RepID=UPI0032F055E2